MTHLKHGWNQQGGMCGRKKEKQKRSLKPEGGRRARSSSSDSGGRRKSGADQRPLEKEAARAGGQLGLCVCSRSQSALPAPLALW